MVVSMSGTIFSSSADNDNFQLLDRPASATSACNDDNQNHEREKESVLSCSKSTTQNGLLFGTPSMGPASSGPNNILLSPRRTGRTDNGGYGGGGFETPRGRDSAGFDLDNGADGEGRGRDTGVIQRDTGVIDNTGVMHDTGALGGEGDEAYEEEGDQDHSLSVETGSACFPEDVLGTTTPTPVGLPNNPSNTSKRLQEKQKN